MPKDWSDTRTEFEKRLDRYEKDLASLEEHVQHIAATLVAIVEGAKAAQEAADEADDARLDAEDRYPEDGGW